MPSHLKSEIFLGVGDDATQTIDIRSDAGYVLLRHSDPAVLQADYIELTEVLQREMIVVR